MNRKFPFFLFFIVLASISTVKCQEEYEILNVMVFDDSLVVTVSHPSIFSVKLSIVNTELEYYCMGPFPVSYTHLTLPTTERV